MVAAEVVGVIPVLGVQEEQVERAEVETEPTMAPRDRLEPQTPAGVVGEVEFKTVASVETAEQAVLVL